MKQGKARRREGCCNAKTVDFESATYCHLKPGHAGPHDDGAIQWESWWRIRVTLLFAWYDFWVGAFWDRRKQRLYVLPIPCVGFVVQFGASRGAGR